MPTGDAPTVAEAFRLIERRDAAGALRIAARLVKTEPANARAFVAAGVALRMLGERAQARSALERAVALDGADYGAAYELGVVLWMSGDAQLALAQFERAAALRPGFLAAHHEARHARGWLSHQSGNPAAALPELQAAAEASPERIDWRLDVAKALADLHREGEAAHHYERAFADHPRDAEARIAYGRYAVSRGDYARARHLFSDALAIDPGRDGLALYLGQVELMLGNWQRGWQAFAQRSQRRAFEALRAEAATGYRVPALGELANRDVTLIGEQGLGDVLFFLRFAPLLAARGARLHFVGDARLHPLLARSALFATLVESSRAAEAGATLPILVADLPMLAGGDALPPSLAIAPDPARLAAWRRKLEDAGPRPWVGVTWRAGTPDAIVANSLFKTVPIAGLMGAVAPWGGTAFALQRLPADGEIAAASQALGRTVHDATRMNDDLEDALALVALLDRHVGVSNTNMHLAALAGSTADVLVPFPPEWRWGVADASPWFPGFRIHRQEQGGGWERALESLAQAS